MPAIDGAYEKKGRNCNETVRRLTDRAVVLCTGHIYCVFSENGTSEQSKAAPDQREREEKKKKNCRHPPRINDP